MKSPLQSQILYWLLLFVFLGAAFVQGYNAVKDLNWGYDYDSNRDMAFANSMLDNEYGEDPSYLNEYIWYNPLVTVIESAIVKCSNFPLNIVISRAGAFLNLLAPLAFFLMMSIWFDKGIALAATAGFIFFNLCEMPGWTAASYSPWLYPVVFVQSFFYIGVAVVYKAFNEWKRGWFILLGIILGICFTGHSAPTLILILITLVLAFKKIRNAKTSNRNKMIFETVKKGSLSFLLFAAISLPFTYFVVGKYQLHMQNTYAYEYTNDLFQWYNLPELILKNLSFSLLISIFGAFFFFRKGKDKMLSQIIIAWIMICVVLYIYTSAIVIIRYHLNIKLPGIVPSFHFFFYLKSLQALFFGIGLYQLLSLVYQYFINRFQKFRLDPVHFEKYFLPVTLLLMVAVNYPFYANSYDLKMNEDRGIYKNNAVSQNEVYNWILGHTDDNKVFLCSLENSDFPMLATGRKMVAVSPTMSNPYVDYITRNEHRNEMLSMLAGETPFTNNSLFKEYSVSYLLVDKNEKQELPLIQNIFPHLVFANSEFYIYSIH
ncbi:MAG: hypothetical protein ABI723_26085 [Bacteroidia bacterium]